MLALPLGRYHARRSGVDDAGHFGIINAAFIRRHGAMHWLYLIFTSVIMILMPGFVGIF